MQRLKENPMRSELYRRLVASMPCSACEVWGYSQAAHPPPTGKGIKQDDRLCFPLCCVRPGVNGCHFLFDNAQIFNRVEMKLMAHKWSLSTQDRIKENGDWRPEWD